MVGFPSGPPAPRSLSHVFANINLVETRNSHCDPRRTQNSVAQHSTWRVARRNVPSAVLDRQGSLETKTFSKHLVLQRDLFFNASHIQNTSHRPRSEAVSGESPQGSRMKICLKQLLEREGLAELFGGEAGSA